MKEGINTSIFEIQWHEWQGLCIIFMILKLLLYQNKEIIGSFAYNGMGE